MEQENGGLRGVEEIVFSMLSDGRCRGKTFIDLAKQYRSGSIGVEEVRIFDAVYKASLEIRRSLADKIQGALDIMDLKDEQEDAILAAVLDDDLVQLSRADTLVPSHRLCMAYDSALGTLSRLVGRAARWDGLWDDVRSVLVSEARFLREDDPVEVVIATNGRFGDHVRMRIVDRLMTDPNGSEEFLGMLAAEISAFLSSGKTIEGTWGAVELHGGNLLYRLTAKEKISYEPSTKKTMEIDL
jgi:hypothetical protein